MTIAAVDANGSPLTLNSSTSALGEVPGSAPVDPVSGLPFKASSEATLAALNLIAAAIQSAVDSLNSKTTAVDTDAIGGTVELGGTTLAALESIQATTGGLTDAQLRASPLALPAGAATDAAQTDANAYLAELAEASRAMQRACEILVNNTGLPDTSGRSRVLLDAISASLTLATITTVSTVTTVGTVSNQTQIGGYAANDMLPAAMANSAGWLRNNITVS